MEIKMRVTQNRVSMSAHAAKIVYIGGEPYTGDCTVVPCADKEVILHTTGKLLDDDVTVKKIPFYETSNTQGGKTAYIGSEV